MKKILKKVWHFIWEDNSVFSWVVNIILAFILIKFLVYPGLGFLLVTSNPVVAVVSGSMEHDNQFDDWWRAKEKFYTNFSIKKTDFETFQFNNGFNEGDLMILKGKNPNEFKIGETIVFQGSGRDPIIHRIISIKEINGKYFFSTKGDNNDKQLAYEKNISEEQVIGKAVLRIPLLGYVKIIFTETVNTLLNGA
ncbi:signal peptidase I [Candidatus Woesearchaeota archaeon]|nr:signal peptidase I [Candidatus Woesearchaeota archaeon]|tara:strand:+ start:24012 stop:24593 length:582 start_codon:yes stop_codon:yes gene_type:complete